MKHISKLDVIVLLALALITGGVYELFGAGVAMLTVGILLLAISFLLDRGGRQ